METKDFIIYQAIASAAQNVFDKMNVDAGKYSAKELHAIICKDAANAPAPGDDDAEKAPQLFAPDFDGSDVIRVSFDGYKCSFLAGDVFSTLSQIETAWGVPTARRAKFIRAAAAASVAVRFDLNAVFKDVIKARLTDKNEIEMRPNMAYICVDTQRRAVVASDGHILNAVAVPNMFVSGDAEKNYIINADLVKTGKGTLTIDTAGNCTINGQTCAARADLRFPNWESVAPAVAESCKIYLGVDVFKRLQKTVATVAKNHYLGHVSLSGVAGNNYITVCAVDIDFKKEFKINVDTPQPLTFDFHTLIQSKRFAAVPVAVDSLYLHPFKSGAGCLLFAAENVISLLMPLCDDDIKFPVISGDAETRPAVDVAKFAALDAENTPAALASVQDVADAPQNSAPAVNVCPPAAKVEILTADFVPAVDDDIKTAVNGVLCAYYWGHKFSGSFRQIFGRAYLQRNNIYFDELNGRFINRAGVLFAVAAADRADVAEIDENETAPAVPVLFGADAEKFTKDRAAAEDAARAAAAAEDAETSAPADNVPAVSDSVPAGCPLDVETWKNLQIYCTCFYKEIDVNENYMYLLAHGVKLIFGEIYLFDRLIGRYEKEIKDYLCVNVSFSWINQENAPAPTPGDDDAAPAADSESVPTCAADSAPAVAVSLPVAVSAKNTWYAIYQAEKLINIVFSRAVADDMIINSLFVPGRTLDAVPVDDPNSAPETRTFGRGDDNAAPADNVPAADPESVPAAADNVPTPGDDDAAPALLIAANFAERARRVFQIAAFFAVLLILAAAPRAVKTYIIDAPRNSAPAVNVAVSDSVPAWDDDAAPAADPENVAVFCPVAAESVAADSLPAAEKTSAPAPQKRAKRARRAAASVQGAPAVAVAAADSVKTCAADNVPAVAADSINGAVSLPVAADSVAADSLPAVDTESAPETNGAVSDSVPTPGDDAAPAADPESAPADNVPADSVPAPAPGAVSVPAVAAAASVGPAAAVLALYIAF
jgi:hypothetical protein